MELTQVASWLNNTFAEYDFEILKGLHTLAQNAGNIMTPIMKGISFLGENGILFIILSICFMLFKKTRKLGICMFGAVACGAIITNFVFKDLIARPRPYLSNVTYASWWEYVGKVEETGFSFPSGHVTATMATMSAIFLVCNKKYSWLSFILVILMGISRNYLMVHFPSDVLGGVLAGAIGATVAYFVTKLIYYILNKHSDNKFFKFILEFNILKNR